MDTQFSVLSSIYHKENPQYFEECMQSIWVNQSIKPSEMILVKDGVLTSELDKIIDKWQKELGNVLKVIALPKNVGLGNALNEGLKNCSYDWVFRMDTDDICIENRFEKQLKYIKQHPDLVLLGGQIEEFNTTVESIIAKRLVPTEKNKIIEFAQKRSPFNHPTIAYRIGIIEKLGGYQHHLLMEDYNLWIRVLAHQYEVANLPDTLLYMRTNGMHGRRRGWVYIKSEWQLCQLKRKLKFQSRSKAYLLFIIRSLVRLLPASFLESLYQLLRKSS